MNKMGLKEIVEKIFGKEPDLDLRPTSCCDKTLSWDIFKEEGYSGFYSNCVTCKSTYVQKLKSDLFVSDDKPKIYIKKKGEGDYSHSKCGTKVKSLTCIRENEEGIIFHDIQGRSFPKRESAPYCPQCEAPEKVMKLARNAIVVPMSSGERYLNRILDQE